MNSKLNACEVFLSVQGEGICTGTPSIFIRLSGCNLHCMFKNPDGEITPCDSPFASIMAEKPQFTSIFEVAQEVTSILEQYPEVKHIVVTGGEPMIQQKALESLFDIIIAIDPDVFITIETNGTIRPSEKMIHTVDLWSISPKLQSSAHFEGTDIPKEVQKRHNLLRINPQVLSSYITKGSAGQLKFVYTGKECVPEIEFLLENIKGKLTGEVLNTFIYDWDVLLMPEGICSSELNKSIDNGLLDACYKHGWRMTDRLQIRVWGNTRGV